MSTERKLTIFHVLPPSLSCYTSSRTPEMRDVTKKITQLGRVRGRVKGCV